MPALSRLARLILVLASTAAALPAGAADAWKVDCATGDRCTATQTLVNADTGKPFASVGLQINKDSTEAIFFAIVPVGIAVRPGVRAVLGTTELLAPVDVCYPDGCRASLPLDAAQLDALLNGTGLDLQFFAYAASDTPLAGAADVSGLRAALAGQVTFR